LPGLYSRSLRGGAAVRGRSTPRDASTLNSRFLLPCILDMAVSMALNCLACSRSLEQQEPGRCPCILGTWLVAWVAPYLSLLILVKGRVAELQRSPDSRVFLNWYHDVASSPARSAPLPICLIHAGSAAGFTPLMERISLSHCTGPFSARCYRSLFCAAYRLLSR
jgi:hypothetical protein